jgi:hypothetical protein
MHETETTSRLASHRSGLYSERPSRLPAVVLVEVLERGVEVLVAIHPVHVHRRRDELLVVDRPVPVGVGLHASMFIWSVHELGVFIWINPDPYSFHELLDFGLAQLGALVGQPSPQLVHGDGAAAVGVHALEHLLEPTDLLLRQAPRDDPQRRLLELVHGPELLQPAEDRVVQRRVRRLAVLLDPRMVCTNATERDHRPFQ